MDDCTQQGLLSHICQFLSKCTGKDVTSIEPSAQFIQFGLNSVNAINMMAMLSTLLKKQLSPTLPWEYSSPITLSQFLIEGVQTSTARPKNHEKFLEQNEAIAVIGMACRFPSASNLDAYWKLLSEGFDAVKEIPESRFSLDRFYHSDPSAPGKMQTRYGAFIENVDEFDPSFFEISPKEAIEMDPQHRIALELTWEALQNAGIKSQHISKTEVGVYFGATWNDYADLNQGVPTNSPYRATGQAINMIASRISYFLGVNGPSLTVDTACSSSLTAIHLACQGLRLREASIAIVGGVNLILSPTTMINLSKTLGLAPDGRCKAFSSEANGPGRGEGCGVVILKPLKMALQDGDSIHCVIRASAVNNDGRSNGLTAPNREAQESLLMNAYNKAGIVPHQVHYVEAHGTGTSLGDPIEAAALGAIVGAGREQGNRLLIGTVKSNIGHLEPASGMAGLLKTILSMNNRIIPASLHAEKLNPYIPFSKLGLKLANKLTPWPTNSFEDALAGVSSFGWGGTNTHVVLSSSVPSPQIFLLEEGSRDDLLVALNENSSAQKMTNWPSDIPDGEIWRFATCGYSKNEIENTVKHYLSNDAVPHAYTQKITDKKPKTVFVFSPGGGQWIGMGRQMMRTEAVFRHTFLACDKAISPYLGRTLFDLLFNEDTQINFDDVLHLAPLVFSLQVALAAQWRHWGILPDVLVGHSVGEIAAAHVSGIIDLETSARIIWHYAKGCSTIEKKGGMAAVNANADIVSSLLNNLSTDVVIAAKNAPDTTIISGEINELDRVIAAIKQQKVKATLIKVAFGGHSSQVDPILEDLRIETSAIKVCHPHTPFISSITCEYLTAEDFENSYVLRGLRECVCFTDVMKKLLDEECSVFVELSSHPLLTHAMKECVEEYGKKATVVSSLSMTQDERLTMYESRCQLFSLGLPTAVFLREKKQELLVLSARSNNALNQLAKLVSERVLHASSDDLSDICFTAANRRDHESFRLAVCGSSGEEISRKLISKIKQNNSNEKVIESKGSVFVFSGQGSHWAGMGRELINKYPVFKKAVQSCDELIKKYASFSLMEQLIVTEDASRLNETAISQPAIFAMQVGITKLWESMGIKPAAVIGHSVGEIAAAFVAGILKLEDAIRLVCLRGQIMEQGKKEGAMVSVFLKETDTLQAIQKFGKQINIAAYNDDNSIVLSGDKDRLQDIVDKLNQQGTLTKMLPVNYAFHSHHMDTFDDKLSQALVSLELAPASCPIYSTVTGGLITSDALIPAYWGANIRQPVLFSQAIKAIIADDYFTFIEVGAHPVVSTNILKLLNSNKKNGIVLPSLRKSQPVDDVFFNTLGELYRLGFPIDFSVLYPFGRTVSLPNYPWQRQKYWVDFTSLPADINLAPQGSHERLNIKAGEQEINANELLIRLHQMHASERYDFLYEEIINEIGIVSGIDTSVIEPTTPFMSLGIDSFMGVQLRGRFEKKFFIELPPTLIWTYPYMDVFINYLLSVLIPEEAADQKKAELQFSALSDKEKDNLLSETLSNLGYE